MQKTLDDSPEQVYNSTRKVTETLKNQRRNIRMNYWAIFWATAPVAACMVLIFASDWIERTGEVLLDWWRRHHE